MRFDCACRFTFDQRFFSGSAFTEVMSRTGCISVEAIRREGLTEASTNYDHLKQEGFTCLVDC